MDFRLLTLNKLTEYESELRASVVWWQNYQENAVTTVGASLGRSHVETLERRIREVKMEINLRKLRGERVESYTTPRQVTTTPFSKKG